MEISLDNILDDFDLRISRKWNFPWQHDVENNTDRPDIDFLVVVLQKHFRCDIIWTSTHSCHVLFTRVIFRKSKINHFYTRWVSFCLKHKILRFDVPRKKNLVIIQTRVFFTYVRCYAHGGKISQRVIGSWSWQLLIQSNASLRVCDEKAHLLNST